MIEVRVNVSGVAADARATLERLRRGLREATLDAARAGIEEARRNHPYTDRTGVLSGYRGTDDPAYRGAGPTRQTATAATQVPEDELPPGEEAADMVWPAMYASFVDEGTRRTRPYPYTPQAVQAAERALVRNVERVLQELSR